MRVGRCLVSWSVESVGLPVRDFHLPEDKWLRETIRKQYLKNLTMSIICTFANEEPLSLHSPKHTNNHQFSLVQILIQSCHSGGSIFPNKLMTAVFGRHCEQRLWFRVGLSGGIWCTVDPSDSSVGHKQQGWTQQTVPQSPATSSG